MKGSDQDKRKSYSLVYRIYRRLRYIRYKKRKKKIAVGNELSRQREEQRQHRLEIKEHVRQLRRDEKIRVRYEKDRLNLEKEEIRKLHKEQLKLASRIRRDEAAAEKARKNLEKADLRKKNKRLFRYMMRQRLRSFFRAIRNFRLKDIHLWLLRIKDTAPAVRRFLVIVLNSTILFLLSYLALYLLHQAVTIVASMLFNYPTILYYWGVFFNIGVEDWFHDSVKTIFSAGPLAALISSISFIIIYTNIKEHNYLFKLFFLWGFLHGVSMFFGAMLVGTLFESGIGHVISWMYISDTGKLLYSIISIFMLVVAGFISIKPFLVSANTYYQHITKTHRRNFIWAQVILPFLFGNIILIALRQPKFMFYETFATFSIAICLIPVISMYSAYRDLFFDEEKREVTTGWREALILAAIIIFYRGILNFGITFPG